MKVFLNKYGIWLLVIINFVLVFLNQSTYDGGDSFLHYLQAKQSFEHPQYFLNHWGKPIYVLFASGFAQFGFVGVKLFNTLCVVFSIWMCVEIAKHFKRPNPKVIWILALFAPHIFLVQSSGLTEPLFALFLSLGSLLYLKKRPLLSLTVLSFLPFIRSEGWLIMIVAAVMLSWRKEWKYLPYLLIGNLVYGIVGLIALNDFLWMFNHNPYTGVEVKYGQGGLLHFFNQLPYLLGWPIFLFLLTGLVRNLQEIVRSRFKLTPYHFLIVGGFLALFVSHSLFWYFGWFHSFGLKRVLLAVLPGMVLLAYDGFNWSLKAFDGSKRTYIQIGLLVLVMIFPFTKNKAGFDIPDNFKLTVAQENVKQASEWYKEQKPSVVSFGHYYFAETLAVDIDDIDEVILVDGVIRKTLPSDTYVFWDDYFCPSDKGVKESDLQNSDYQFMKEFVTKRGPKQSRIAVYRKK